MPELTDAAAPRVTTPAGSPLPVGRRRGLAVGAASLLAGGLVAYAGAVAADGAPGLLRVGVTLLGLAVAVNGLGRSLRAVRGRPVDLALWFSVVWLCGLALAALLADLLPLGNADDTTQTIGVAGYATPDLFSAHPLGTNGFGLDLLARSIYGARVSLLTVGVTVLVSLVVGGLIGMVAGYFRGWVDVVIGVFADAALVIPALVLLIAFAAVLGPSRTVPEAVLKSGAALAVVGIPTVIRLARANTMVHAQRESVTAARAMGARHRRIILRELLPNVALPLVSYAFIVAAVLIVAEGSLAFLGLGLQQPTPSWGNMIAEGGLRELRRHPHVPIVPGVFMFLTVFSLNIIGERARGRWDARDLKT